MRRLPQRIVCLTGETVAAIGAGLPLRTRPGHRNPLAAPPRFN